MGIECDTIYLRREVAAALGSFVFMAGKARLLVSVMTGKVARMDKFGCRARVFLCPFAWVWLVYVQKYIAVDKRIDKCGAETGRKR